MAEPLNGTPLPAQLPTSEEVQAAVSKIEVCQDELLSERGAYMQKCRQIREGIAAAYDLAKQRGILRKQLRALLKERDLERKLHAVRADLEADEVEHFDFLKQKLGDLAETPLGQAALKRADTGALDALMTDDLIRDDSVKH
ncbi:MAG TPA: hypothetical protein VGH62_11925 [Bradyrhizobium sp.]|jgi:F0F1-type ATP synthase membrane subunit b/b'